MDSDSNEAALAKADLRKRLRFRRDHFVQSLSDFERAIAFRMPPAPLRQVLTHAKCVGGYAAHGSEAPVDALLALARAAGCATGLPCFSARDAAMDFADWTIGEALQKGPWQVMQPAEHGRWLSPDVLLCPLLGFDRLGGRLGYGGGHYDRYCASHPTALRIGIAWSIQEVDAISTEPHDIALDAVLTEQEWIVTGERL